MGLSRLKLATLGQLKSSKRAFYKADNTAEVLPETDTSKEDNLNGTTLTEAENRFDLVAKRISQHKDYKVSKDQTSGYGSFMGRPIIAETTTILGGIYLGVEPHEAIVVDEKYGFLSQAYSELMLRYVKNFGTTKNEAMDHELIKEVINFTKTKLTYLSDNDFKIFAEREKIIPDQKIALDVFIKFKQGTDRHHLLLAAYLIEKLIKKGHLRGKLYLDSHYFSNKQGNKKSLERLVYSSRTGYLFIYTPSAEN